MTIQALVTSANFTEWAQQRNVEAGVLIRDRHFACQLRQQFDGLMHSKQVRRLAGFRSSERFHGGIAVAITAGSSRSKISLFRRAFSGPQSSADLQRWVARLHTSRAVGYEMFD